MKTLGDSVQILDPNSDVTSYYYYFSSVWKYLRMTVFSTDTFKLMMYEGVIISMYIKTAKDEFRH